MKQVKFLIVAAVLAVCSVSCGNQNANEDYTEMDTSSTSTNPAMQSDTTMSNQGMSDTANPGNTRDSAESARRSGDSLQ